MKMMQLTPDRQATFLTALCTVPPQIRDLILSLPPDVVDQLTTDDLQRFIVALGRPTANHLIDYRLSLPIGYRRFYIRFLCGRERRKISRIIAEGQANPWLVLAAMALLFWFMMTVTLALIVVGVYLLKTVLGIDLFDGPSFLHRLLLSDY